MVVTKGTRKQGRGVGRMSHRTAAWLAWSLCAVCVALIGIALLLDFLTDTSVIHAGYFQSAYEERGLLPGDAHPSLTPITGVLSLAYPMVGALIASRLPTNPIGWIFCGMGVLYGARRFTGAYADYALLENLAFPGGEFMAWFTMCIRFASLTLGVFLILLFPDGRLPSRRWRLVAWATIFGAALVTLGFAFMPEYLFLTHPYVENPFEIVGVIGGGFTTYELFGVSRFIGMMLLLASTLAALISPILRLHRTRGNERQQIKWFLFAAVPLTVFLGLIELNLLISILTHDFMFQTVEILQSWQVLTPALIADALASLV